MGPAGAWLGKLYIYIYKEILKDCLTKNTVVCCWSLMVGCWLLAVVGWLLLAVGCWLLVVGCCCSPFFSVIETEGSQTLVRFFNLKAHPVDLLVLRIGIIKAYLKDLEKLKRHGTYYTPGN